MSRSLYSLILSDDIILAVDRLASRMNTNRSILVNQILADYVSIVTPEKKIENIFNVIENVLSQQSEVIPLAVSNGSTMTMKSCLQYKYRPTIKYSISLDRSFEDTMGQINVTFRTQSCELLKSIYNFFLLFKKLESSYLSKHYNGVAIRYEISDTRFARSIYMPDGSRYSNQQIADKISEYIKMFDTLLKSYICEEFTNVDLEDAYVDYLSHGVGLI